MAPDLASPRFIPARAGNGSPPPYSCSFCTVHPRARGERSSRTGTRGPLSGSSPRARGTARTPPAWTARPRFIPARAGNGLCLPRSCDRRAVHPRARGERKVHMSRKRLIYGSSPRARGTGWCLLCYLKRTRFIPARAGNGSSGSSMELAPTVHPRARGERTLCPAGTPMSIGSSPRARGTGSAKRGRIRPGRFIPARAGNGCAPHLAQSDAAVHPRARGERTASLHRGGYGNGSSPRARGTALARRPQARWLRFIPARAGNGYSLCSTTISTSVHPRARGERIGLVLAGLGGIGSSPRARGTAVKQRDRDGFGRFIPARAGNGAEDFYSSVNHSVHPRARGERSGG